MSLTTLVQVKSRKRLRQEAAQFSDSDKTLADLMEASVPASKRRLIQTEADLLKSELTNAHLRKMLTRMVDEQNRLELLFVTLEYFKLCRACHDESSIHLELIKVASFRGSMCSVFVKSSSTLALDFLSRTSEKYR